MAVQKRTQTRIAGRQLTSRHPYIFHEVYVRLLEYRYSSDVYL